MTNLGLSNLNSADRGIRPSTLLTRQLANPIHFPGLAAVWRKRLLHARRLWRDVQPDVAHQNDTALEVFLMEKLTALARESANHGRRIKRSIVDIDQMDAPLPRLGVVQPQRLRLDMEFLIGAGDLELFEVRVAVEDLVVV